MKNLKLNKKSSLLQKMVTGLTRTSIAHSLAGSATTLCVDAEYATIYFRDKRITVDIIGYIKNGKEITIYLGDGTNFSVDKKLVHLFNEKDINELSNKKQLFYK